MTEPTPNNSKPFELELSRWQIEVACMLKDFELEHGAHDVADKLFKVFEEVTYADSELTLDQDTRIGELMLMRIITTILKTKDPDTKLLCKITFKK